MFGTGFIIPSRSNPNCALAAYIRESFIKHIPAIGGAGIAITQPAHTPVMTLIPA